MTPAVDFLKENNIKFSVHKYKHQKGVKAFGKEAIELLGLDSNEVFKTLIVASEFSSHIVAIIPVAKTLDLNRTYANKLYIAYGK